MSENTNTTMTAKELKAQSLKALKSSPEVETFYRFILDNNLRLEAHALMKMALESISPKAKRKAKKLQ